jgi:prepilin signal peptidase PulO-like enzyme (type II secretory pathway)
LLLFIASYFFWPIAFHKQGVADLVIWLLILINLIALAVYDIRWLTLPNKIMYVLYALIALQILVTIIFFDGRLHFVLNSLFGLLIGGGVFYILFQISSGKWIGGGDVKLGAMLGLYLGSAIDAVLMIFFASVLGSLFSIPLLATGKFNRKTLIPYGPFLILAAIILRLFGSTITSWLNTKGILI